MQTLKQILLSIAAAAVAVAASATAGMARDFIADPLAGGYTGSWPVTITEKNNTYTGCLTLSGSGTATVVIGSQRYNGGSYFVVNKMLVATVPAQGYGQNAGLVFIGRTMRSKLGAGAFDEVYGGSDFASGSLAFGMKGGC